MVHENLSGVHGIIQCPVLLTVKVNVAQFQRLRQAQLTVLSIGTKQTGNLLLYIICIMNPSEIYMMGTTMGYQLLTVIRVLCA